MQTGVRVLNVELVFELLAQDRELIQADLRNAL